MVFTNTSAFAAQWIPFENQNIGAGSGITLIDSNAAMSAQSAISIVRNGSAETVCGEWGSGACKPGLANVKYYATIVMPLCESKTQSYCVEDVSIYKAGQAATGAIFLGEAFAATSKAVPSMGLPKGGSALLYQAPDVVNSAGTDTYYVAAVSELNYVPSTNRFVYLKTAVIALPYTSVQRPFHVNETKTAIPVGTKLRNGVIAMENEYTLNLSRGMTPDMQEIVGEDFASDTRFGISFRLPSEAHGWFSGRMSDPNFSLKTLSSTNNSISVQGTAIAVHRTSAVVPQGITTPEMDRLNLKRGNAGIEAGSDFAVNWVQDLRKYANDTDDGETTVWSLRSSEVTPFCFPKNKFNGLVTTNATAYSWNPPEYKSGTLSYQVGGMHFNADKTLAKGSYDLILSSSVARCLYNFSKAPFSASVSIVDSQTGEKDIATTLVSQDSNWLKITARNFGFSNKTIKIKLTQKKK